MVVSGSISFSYDQQKYQAGEKLEPIGMRLEECSLVHVSYENIHTEAIEKGRTYSFKWFWFENSWNEPWGKVIKWSSLRRDKAYYEFFVANVASRDDLLQRLTELLSWVDANCPATGSTASPPQDEAV